MDRLVSSGKDSGRSRNKFGYTSVLEKPANPLGWIGEFIFGNHGLSDVFSLLIIGKYL
jgi:hypothetical protein